MSSSPAPPSPTHSSRTGAGESGNGRPGGIKPGEINPGRGRVLAIGSYALAAVLLTIVFWRPLWTGGGLVGSDIYAYYLPQKAFFADSLRAGVLPVWNNLVGHGYPLVAESQTGVFYPLHWAFY